MKSIIFLTTILFSTLSFEIVLSFDDYYDYYNSNYNEGQFAPLGSARYQTGRRFNPGYRVQNDYGEFHSRLGQNGRRRAANFKLSWGSKGKYKTSSSGSSMANAFGNTYGYKGAHDNEGSANVEGQVNNGISSSIGGTSKGQGKSAFIGGNEWLGSGTSVVGGSHDVGGEAGVALD